MQFQNTNATDTNGLLVALKTFLAANGWTIVADGTGGGGLVLEVQNSAGHKFKFTSTLATPTWYGIGVINDRRIHIAWDKAAIGLAAGYSSKAIVNDLTGPFPNIWFITDNAATYCHVIAQIGDYRYSHFSFGNLDPRGLHSVALPFAACAYWQYWQTVENYSTSGDAFNRPDIYLHQIGQFGNGSNLVNDYAGLRLGLPTGLLDSTIGFAAGAVEAPSVHYLCDREYFRTVNADNVSQLLDFSSSILNHSHTGGVNIAPLPMLVNGNPDASLRAHVGDLPNMGYVNMIGLAPGQVLTFAGDEWIVFPLKQYGLRDNCHYGSAPLPKPNSAFYGFAYKKAEV